jgi:anti-sigma B factor antagonist
VQYDLALRAETAPQGLATLRLAGVIDAHTLDKFEAALGKLVGTGAKALVLDCEELRYVNSSGFGELIRYFDRLREKGGSLVLARVPPKVAIILEMLGLKSLIPMASTLEEAKKLALSGPPPKADPSPAPPPVPAAATPRATARPAAPAPALRAEERIVACAFCDTRLRIGGGGRWTCPACGAPFSATAEGGIAFDWTHAEAEAVHLTFDVSPRALAAFAGLLEGVLTERRVSHARMRRFAREAAHLCHLLAEHAYAGGRRGPLHALVLAGPQRMVLRIVDRGRPIEGEAARVLETTSKLFLDFRYGPVGDGANLTELAFAYEGSGVFVG